MRILLLNPPYLPRYSRSQRSPAVTKSGTLYWPMWLAYGAASLDAAGHDVTLIDAPAADLDMPRVMASVRKKAPGLVVLDTSTPSIAQDLETARILKESLPTTHIVMVGTHVSALAEETLAAGTAVDSIARREYEQTLVELAAALEEPSPDLSSIKGLSHRSEGEIVHAPDRPFLQDLDSLPMVSPIYRRFLDARHYFNPNALYPMVAIMGSRGCPFHCSFCVYPQTLSGHQLRKRSPAGIAEEFRYVAKEMPRVRAIFFEDDTFTADRDWCREVALELIRLGNKLSFTANARADVDLDTLRLLKRAGLRQVCVGFESATDDTLAAMDKGLMVAAARRFMVDARRAGILVHGCFMFGTRGETRDSFARTVGYAISLSPDTAQFYPVMVYPGTTAYDRVRQAGALATEDFREWLREDGGHRAVVRTKEMTPDEITAYCDEARRRFYLRPSYAAYKAIRLMNHPSEIPRTIKAFRTFMKHLIPRTTH